MQMVKDCGVQEKIADAYSYFPDRKAWI
jgi:hypothetical protein